MARRCCGNGGSCDQDACIVGEPSELQIGLAERGGAWFTATAFGKAAHGSQPHRGVNAITSMSRFLLRLPEVLPDAEHPLTGRPTVNAALISGGSAPNVVPRPVSGRHRSAHLPRRDRPRPGPGAVRGARGRHPARPPRGRHRHRTSGVDRCSGSLARHDDREPGSSGRRCRNRVPNPSSWDSPGITDARFYINQAVDPHGDPGARLTDRGAHRRTSPSTWTELVAGARAYARIFAAFVGA